MILYIDGSYIADVDVEIERKAKVFEDIEATQGDFSYSFDFQNTAEVRKSLGIDSVDQEKAIYRKRPAELRNEVGIIYSGAIQIERIDDFIISASFYSGNSGWFELIQGNLRDLYDTQTFDYTTINVLGTWGNTSGFFFPWIDAGLLSTRGNLNLVNDDFHPFYYVKDVITKILGESGIKITGNLLTEWRYERLIVSSGIAQDFRISQRRVETTIAPFTSTEAGGPDTVASYTSAVYASTVKITGSVTLSGNTPDVVRFGVSNQAGSFKYSYEDSSIGFEYIMKVDAGSTINVFVEVLNTGGSVNVTGGTVVIEPEFIYSFKVNEILPNWTKQQFIVNIFRLFNCIVTYEPNSRTITANLFEKITSQDAIDLSDYVVDEKYDFVDFISTYGQRTYLKFSEYDSAESYNASNFLSYGSGQIDVVNDFIQKEADAVESEFVAPLHEYEPILKANVEQFSLVEVDTIEELPYTAVTDSGGVARFTMASTGGLSAGDLVRIESDDPGYRGDFFVETVGAGFIELVDLDFNATATGNIFPLLVRRRSVEDAFILLALPSTPVGDFSDSGFGVANVGYAYFNLLRTGKNIDRFKQSLSFGDINLEGDFQRKLKEDYYSRFSKMLQDPVKGTFGMKIPYDKFLIMDSQRPVFVKTRKTQGLYYLSKTSGYRNSYQVCDVELNKL